MTATEVVGLGQGPRQAGATSSGACAALQPRIRVDIVVHDDVVDAVIDAIAKCANAGTIGDGKIWVSPVDSVLRTRTGERDNSDMNGAELLWRPAGQSCADPAR